MKPAVADPHPRPARLPTPLLPTRPLWRALRPAPRRRRTPPAHRPWRSPKGLALLPAEMHTGENSTTGRCRMKAIVVTDEAAGTAGMTLVERPEPPAAINDVI